MTHIVVNKSTALTYDHNPKWVWGQVDKSTDNAKPHSICFFFYHDINDKENVFLRARAEKGIAGDIDASSVVLTLIENGKLANQITR